MCLVSIEVAGVSRWYGNVVAVNDISFGIGPGVTGLLGPNGAGKTTLLHVVAGFLAPSAGTVTIDGTATWRHPGLYARIGLVPERESVYPFLTGRQFVEASARLQRLASPEEATARAIEMVEMGDAAGRAIGGYSKGMRQRIKVASALVHDPPILVLDEPFNGMDPRQRLHMMALLRQMASEGRTILFSSHILEEVERLAERVLVIVAGRLAAAGNFREIRRLMTDRPHTFSVRSSNDRALAAALVAHASVEAVSLTDGLLTVRAGDFGAFARQAPGIARRAGVTLREFLPADESLESVFGYLVQR
ncbi:MAG: ABC transporter ATP-binding protein [Candidatus Limnocylindria bacterium]